MFLTKREHAALLLLTACDKKDVHTFKGEPNREVRLFEQLGFVTTSNYRSRVCTLSVTQLGWLYVQHPSLPLPEKAHEILDL